MLSLDIDGPSDVMWKVAQRAKQRRLHENLSQQRLAERAGVSTGSLKLFEQTGKASWQPVGLFEFAHGGHENFSYVFPPPPPRSTEVVWAKPTRHRGVVPRTPLMPDKATPQ